MIEVPIRVPIVLVCCAVLVWPETVAAQFLGNQLSSPAALQEQTTPEISEQPSDSVPARRQQNGSVNDNFNGLGTIQRAQRELFGNTPDDIGSQLDESDEIIDALCPVGPLTPLHKLWDRCNTATNSNCGLNLGLYYTALYQRTAEGADPRDAASDDIDFFGEWNLLGREGGIPGFIAFSSEIRNRYSPIPPSELRGNVGSAYGTTVAFNSQDYALVQLYWQYGSIASGARYRIGRLDPSLIYDGGRYVSQNYAFLSPAFSDTLPMPLPGAGIGIAGAIYPTANTYLLAGIHDANGVRTQGGFNTFFDAGEYFTAVEFGAFPADGDEDRGLWHMTLWHVDPRTAAGKPNDHGIALTLEQEFGKQGNVVPFLRYSYADRGTNPIRENISIGIGLEDVLGQNEDLIGIAFACGTPSDRSLRDEYIFEMFYRIHITPDTHVTPDLQVIIDPANEPGLDSVAVLGLRLRTLY